MAVADKLHSVCPMSRLHDILLKFGALSKVRVIINHDVSAFTIGNTLTKTWTGVLVIRSYTRSLDKAKFLSNFLCVFSVDLE